MKSTIWGPKAWFFLHSVVSYYPDNPTSEQKKYMYDFFMLLPKILPCKKCQNHFQENLNQFPINNYLDSREKLVFWLFTIHNQVNKLLGKSEYIFIALIINFILYLELSQLQLCFIIKIQLNNFFLKCMIKFILNINIL